MKGGHRRGETALRVRVRAPHPFAVLRALLPWLCLAIERDPDTGLSPRPVDRNRLVRQVRLTCWVATTGRKVAEVGKREEWKRREGVRRRLALEATVGPLEREGTRPEVVVKGWGL